MAAPKHILVPVDFSVLSAQAVDYAVELAKALGAKITLLHAYEPPAIGYPDTAGLALEVAEACRRSAETALDTEARERAASGLSLTHELRQGPAWIEIVEAAKERGADLIVMGTHGRGGLSHFLLGSVAERVVRSSPIPVLTVRGRAEG
jgi:nucleotide-binding universal stress UspA family protein